MKKIFLLFLGLFLIVFQIISQTVIDFDGNVYNTVSIGTQVWMKENLKVTHFRNGEPIVNVIDNSAWGTLITSAYCNYDNDANNVMTYGRLYNFYAGIDTRNICPANWHVPADWEWTNLVTYLGGGSVAGGKMKESGNTHWTGANTGADNSSGFTALPGGMRSTTGLFASKGTNIYMWSTTDQTTYNSLYRWIGTGNASIYNNPGSNSYGFTVRCVCDFATSVNEINKNFKIDIYPNPAKNIVSIELQHTKFSKFSVFNLLGVCVIHQSVSNQINTIDISNLSKGIYMIELSNEQGSIYLQKLVKE